MVDHCDSGRCPTCAADWEKTLESAETIPTAQEMPISQLVSFISAPSRRTIPNGGQKQERRHPHGSNRYLSRGEPWCGQKKGQQVSCRPQRQEGLLIEVDPILPPMYTYLFRVLIGCVIIIRVQRSSPCGNASCEYFRGEFRTGPRIYS